MDDETKSKSKEPEISKRRRIREEKSRIREDLREALRDLRRKGEDFAEIFEEIP